LSVLPYNRVTPNPGGNSELRVYLFLNTPRNGYDSLFIILKACLSL